MSLNDAASVAEFTGGRLEGENRVFTGPASIQHAGPDQISFAESDIPTDCTAGVLLVREASSGRTCVVVDDPKLAFIHVLQELFPVEHGEGTHRTASVHPTASIHDTATVHAGVVVMKNCRVGAETVLFPNVVLYPDTVVGTQCRIHAGAVIGADGFSYHPTAQGPVKVPHTGRVAIEDRVEIGANSTIDRAFLGETRVGPGCKLDNMVHVGHNANLGAHVIIAAQTGISGSVTVGDGALIGGQVGIVEHTAIGEGARVGAQSGVGRDVPANSTVLGTPAEPAMQMKRIYAALRRLPEWIRKN